MKFVWFSYFGIVSAEKHPDDDSATKPGGEILAEHKLPEQHENLPVDELKVLYPHP